jgi:hypothetical protein
MIDASVGDESPRQPLTATQASWRERGNEPVRLQETSVSLDLYLTGVPDKDPSNDLFGSKGKSSNLD